MIRYTPTSKPEWCQPTFATPMHQIHATNQVHHVLKTMYQTLVSKLEMFTKMGSGWTVKRIKFLECVLIKCSKFGGGSANHNTALIPLELQQRWAVLNIK